MAAAMIETLSRLRLSSGMPHGAVSVAATLGAFWIAGLLGALLLPRGRARALAVGVAVLAAARLALGVASAAVLSENFGPAVREEELVGSWRDGAEELTLHADRTFVLRSATSETGSWTLADHDVWLGARRARIIEVNGERRIVPRFPHDPERWDGHLGFAREAGR
jgi:hypothetical protein